MLETIEQLKAERPDIVKIFQAMTKEELLDQIYLEVLDGLNMEDRVQLFMNECTELSKTTYTLDSIRTLINARQIKDIQQFCVDLLEDSEGDSEYILAEIKERAKII